MSYIQATLVARAGDLDSRHLLRAARRGYLPTLLSEIGEVPDLSLYEWTSIWEAHQEAGHPCPEYEHTADPHYGDADGIVWGYDRLESMGMTHEVDWGGRYGGEHAGQQFGWGGERWDEWGTWEDGEGCDHCACLEAMAEVYGIELTDGQPAEPTREECERESTPARTVYVVETDGVHEVDIYRYSHPMEYVDEDAALNPWPHYYAADIWGDETPELNTVREVVDYLQDMDGVLAVLDDEHEAETYLLRHLAEEVDPDGLPQGVALRVPRDEDEAPYLYLTDRGDEDEEDRYHPTEDDLRALIAGRSGDLLRELTAAFGRRALLSALTEQRALADERLATEAERIWVTVADSLAAGNCRQGTLAFAARHGIDIGAIGAIRADYLLEIAPRDPMARQAARAAALRLTH